MSTEYSLECSFYVPVHGSVYDDVDAGTEVDQTHTHEHKLVRFIRQRGVRFCQQHNLKKVLLLLKNQSEQNTTMYKIDFKII